MNLTDKIMYAFLGLFLMGVFTIGVTSIALAVKDVFGL